MFSKKTSDSSSSHPCRHFKKFENKIKFFWSDFFMLTFVLLTFVLLFLLIHCKLNFPLFLFVFAIFLLYFRCYSTRRFLKISVLLIIVNQYLSQYALFCCKIKCIVGRLSKPSNAISWTTKVIQNRKKLYLLYPNK